MCILNLDTKWYATDQLHVPTIVEETSHFTHEIGGCVGPTTGLDALGGRKYLLSLRIEPHFLEHSGLFWLVALWH